MSKDANEGLASARGPRRRGRSLSPGSLAVAGAVSGFASGCGAGDVASEGDATKTATHTEALPTTAWDNWHSDQARSGYRGDPSICSNHIGYLVTWFGENRRYSVKHWGRNPNPNWKSVGTKEFASPPSCAFLYPADGTDTNFLLAGKGYSDNRLYVVEGIEPEGDIGDPYPPNPDWLSMWTQVSSDEFSGSGNGYPALFSNGSRVVLTYINSNRAYVRYRDLPYDENDWTSVVTAPAFPTSVTASGAPAITYVDGSTDKFVIVVRGVKSNVPAFYWIYFTTSFQGSWVKAPIPYTSMSFPAVEYDTEFNAFTVYFRSGDQVIQSSASTPSNLGDYPFYPIGNLATTTIYGSPRVSYNAGIEGNRAAIVLGYDSDVPPLETSKAFLLTETGDTPYPFL